MLERLAQSTAHVMNVETCSIRMLDETGTRLKLVASHGLSEIYLQRAPNAKALVKQGTGQGLAITRDIVTRYGGQISVRSQLGAGTTFTVTFPIVS